MSNCIKKLPFTKKTSEGTVFWVVQSTGNYTQDCETGQHFASLLLKCIKKNHYDSVLSWVVQDMPPQHTGIETGFLGYIAATATNK